MGFIAILALVVGIVALVVLYSMNSKQNMELANRVAQDVIDYLKSVGYVFTKPSFSV